MPQDDIISVHYVPPENAMGKLAAGKYMVINEDWSGMSAEPRLSSERKQTEQSWHLIHV